jgi:hypothetical protein
MLIRLVVFGVVVLLSGCAKKSSPEFFEAQRRYSSVVLREGDDAYFSEEMDAVDALLDRVPQGAIEAPRAKELKNTIALERRRLNEERAQARPEAEVSAPLPSTPPIARPDTSPAPTAPVPEKDGPPTAGMAEEAFVLKYKECISTKADITLDTPPRKAPAYAARETPNCLQRLEATAGTQFFFIDGKLAGRSMTTTSKTTTATAPKTAEAEAKLEPFLVVPGAPLPAAINSGALPPTPSSLPNAATGTGLDPAKTDGLAPRPVP